MIDTDIDLKRDIEAAVAEAGEDDHPYGAWRGGSVASGGGPASKKGRGTPEQRRKEMAARVGKENVGKETSLTRKLEGKTQEQADEETARNLTDRAAKTNGPTYLTKEEQAAVERRAAAYKAEHADAYRGNPLERRTRIKKDTAALDASRNRDEAKYGADAKVAAAKSVKRAKLTGATADSEARLYLKNRWESQRKGMERRGDAKSDIDRARRNFANGAGIAATELN